MNTRGGCICVVYNYYYNIKFLRVVLVQIKREKLKNIMIKKVFVPPGRLEPADFSRSTVERHFQKNAPPILMKASDAVPTDL